MSRYINHQFLEMLQNNMETHPFITEENIKWIELRLKTNEPLSESRINDIRFILRKTYNEYKNNVLQTSEEIRQDILNKALRVINYKFDIESNTKGMIDTRNEYLEKQEKYDYNTMYQRHSNAVDEKIFLVKK